MCSPSPRYQYTFSFFECISLPYRGTNHLFWTLWTERVFSYPFPFFLVFLIMSDRRSKLLALAAKRKLEEEEDNDDNKKPVKASKTSKEAR